MDGMRQHEYVKLLGFWHASDDKIGELHGAMDRIWISCLK